MCETTQGDTIDSARQTPKIRRQTRREENMREGPTAKMDETHMRNAKVTLIFIVSLVGRYYDDHSRFRSKADRDLIEG